MSNIKQAVSDIHSRLKDHYPSGEIESFICIIFHHLFSFSQIDLYLQMDKVLSEDEKNVIDSITDQLSHYHPIQYITGETEFYGLPLKVSPDVLIPRPETEELVDWIIGEYRSMKSLNILDIGTGSGCIAIALARHLDAKVWAIDVSEAALSIARKNASLNNVPVEFVSGDILSDVRIQSGLFDIIVSNPPYIGEDEKGQMHSNVLDFEPHLALFPPPADILTFYDRISGFGLKYLVDGGSIFFEINENYPFQTKAVLSHYGYTDLELRKDINDKWRMLRGRLRS